MPKPRYLVFCLLVVAISVLKAFAQKEESPSAWKRLDQPPTGPGSELWVRPQALAAFQLDRRTLGQVLRRAPREINLSVAAGEMIRLPMPDGSLAAFRCVEAPVMAPELAAKFPEIKTYRGVGIDDPQATIRFDLTPGGFHGQILSPRGAVYIDPYFRGNSEIHAAYFKRDYRREADGFVCLTPSGETVALRSAFETMAVSGASLRTYRLACAATGEYTQFHGGSVASAMAAIVTAINRVTGVYETEVAIRFELVGNNNEIVYTNPNADPYSNNSGVMMLSQNQANLDDVIGSANYDIGHVFSTGGGGIASLGAVCVSGRKAQGVTGLPSPVGDGFYIDYVSHEIGHQFGANHTFNSSSGSCGGGNRNPATAYEPGSGSTIMAYAGICGSDDLQEHSDPYFHSVSLDEIVSFSSSSSGSICPVTTPTGNEPPSVNAGANFIIPRGTPFVLTAIGTDPDGDSLTYCWEQRDLGASTSLVALDNGFSPLFRSFDPVPNPARTFPKLADILANTTTLGERLPSTNRTMNFRVVARDNRPEGGGINTDSMQVTVAANSGPFQVSSPGAAVTWSNAQTVTWNVAGTTAFPVNASAVDISLSIDGGSSFPIVLASNVPNDGSQIVLLPSVDTAIARIKVQARGNIFFDISDGFSIIKADPAPLIVLESAILASETCPNGAIDPFETVTVNLALRNIGSTNTTNLIVSLLNTNGINAQSGPQGYGMLPNDGSVVTLPLTFMASGFCGGSINALFQLQDGSANLGTVSRSFTLGKTAVVTNSQNNASPVVIPAPGDTRGSAAPYPAAISVSGLTGTVAKVTVTLHGLTHGASDDLDVLLVGPSGQSVLLMSDVGNGGGINNATLTFDDAAATSLSGSSSIASGSFRPTNFDFNSDDFSAPAPGGSYALALSVFNNLNPNGSWSLYIEDDFKQNSGVLAQGWTLTITTSNTTCCPIAPPSADLALHNVVSPEVVEVGGNLVYTLAVTNLGPHTAYSVSVTDAPPANVNFVAASQSQGTHSLQGELIAFSLGTLASGAAATMEITVAAVSAGQATNRAWVSSSIVDANPANDYMAAIALINPANLPPEMAAIGDQTIHAGAILTLSASATDPNPNTTLNYILAEGAPAAATLNPTNGLFSWSTADLDANTTNAITVRVTDDGSPPLSDQRSFTVTVLPRPTIQSITLSNDVITLRWNSIPEQLYRVQYKDALNDSNWTELPPEIIASEGTAAKAHWIGLANQRFYRVLVGP